MQTRSNAHSNVQIQTKIVLEMLQCAWGTSDNKNNKMRWHQLKGPVIQLPYTMGVYHKLNNITITFVL